MSEEMWKWVVGYEELYDVSNKGRVRSYRRKKGTGGNYIISDAPQRILKPRRRQDGRLEVSLCSDGVQTVRLVYHLVLEAFVGPCPPGQECCHGNDIPDDNRCPENIRWDTREENISDAIRNEKFVPPPILKGEIHRNAKLTNEQVLCIKRRIAQGETDTVIARDYGVVRVTISQIRHGRNWSHLHLPAT